jgi:hypothetical protein
VNTVYTWPKLFAGALVLVVAAAILSRDVRPALRALIIGAGSAFAFVAHGSSAFGLIGLVPILWMTRRDWRWSHAITVALLAAAIYLPWSAYQRFVDPPGDRLIKWHLAGVIPPDESVGAAQAIVESYREAGLEGSIVNKLYNVRTVLGDWSLYEGQIRGANPQLGWSSSFVGLLRQATTARLGPSAGLMLLGLLAFAVKRVRSASWSAPTLQIIAASTLAYVLLEWGGNWYSAAWLHTTPASLSVLWAIAGALALAELGEGWLTLAALVQLGAFGIVWARGIFSNAAVPGVVPLDTGDVEMNAIKAGVFLAAVAFVVYRGVKGWRVRGKIARR